MPQPDDLTYRSHYRSRPGDVDLREAEQIEDEDGMMSIRLPIASTGEVRNQGDDPLTRDELDGMAAQVNSLSTGVFPDHGGTNMIAGGVGGDYSQFEKLGYWADGEVEGERAEEGVDVLMATAMMPDPETLPSATGDYRQALAILKEQAKRSIPIDASIGWREDDGYPGGVDLMEASIVGIGADPRTSTAQDASVEVLARAAVDAGADPEALVDAVREAVAPEDARPFGPPNAPNLWDDFEECVSEVEDWEGVDDPEAFCGWAENRERNSTSDHDMTDTEPDPEDEEQQSDQPDEPEEQTTQETDEEEDDEEEMQALGEPMLESVDAFEAALEDHGVEDVYEAVTDLVQEGEMDDEEDEEDEEMDADEPDEAQAADADLDELDERLSDIEDALQAVRSGEADVADPPEPDEEQDATPDDEQGGEVDKVAKYGLDKA